MITGGPAIDVLFEFIERRQLRLLDRTKRMNINIHLRKYLKWRTEGKRRAERPRKRWRNGIQSD